MGAKSKSRGSSGRRRVMRICDRLLFGRQSMKCNICLGVCCFIISFFGCISLFGNNVDTESRHLLTQSSAYVLNPISISESSSHTRVDTLRESERPTYTDTQLYDIHPHTPKVTHTQKDTHTHTHTHTNTHTHKKSLADKITDVANDQIKLFDQMKKSLKNYKVNQAGILGTLRILDTKYEHTHTIDKINKHNKTDIYTHLQTLAEATAKFVRKRDPHTRPRSDMSLLIPCVGKHFDRIHTLIESIKNQTVMPSETIIVLSMNQDTNHTLTVDDFKYTDIPNLKIHMRGLNQTAGHNRHFLINNSKHSLVSFFDCDDFLHPQRTEILDAIFKKRPELDALVHAFKKFNYKNWEEYAKYDFLSHTYTDEEINNWDLPFPYEKYWNARAVIKQYNGLEWDIKNPESEPNYPQKEGWFFPKDMDLQPGLRHQSHNGWVTLRRSVATSVPYPSLKRGQDSVFNWRLMKLHKNWTPSSFVLGAYLARN